MPDYIDENGGLTDEFRAALPELLGDVYYNDPQTKQQPTKELDNVKTVADMAKMVVTGSRKISSHGEELKKATEGMVKIPGEGATEEDVATYRKAIGVPESAEGYTLSIPEDDKEGFEAIAKEVRTAAHEEGISPSKLSKVWDKVVGALVTQNQALEKKGMDLLTADVQALKDAKKEKYDAFIQDTNNVAAHFDVKADPEAGIEQNLIGTDFMKLMDTFGIKDTPVIREFLGAIAPLVLEGKTAIGAGAGPSVEGGPFSYEYDEKGQPI
jgi:hypothetical protein